MVNHFSTFDHLLIGGLVALAVLLYKAQRDLVKNDLKHYKDDIANMIGGLQVSIKFLAKRVGFMSSDLERVKKKLDIKDNG